MAELANDEPMSGLEKLVWWTEYVIRNRGAKHLRNPAADLPLYQYFLLDVASAILVLLGIVAIILVVLFKICLKLLFSILKALYYKSNTRKIEKKKKK